MVLLTGMDEISVTIRNPWGDRYLSEQHSDRGKRLLGNGLESYPRDLFFDLAVGCYLPTS